MQETPPNSGFNHEHANVLDVRISAVNMEEAVGLADRRIAGREPGYICVTGVHGVMEAQADLAFRNILNSAFITAPDGMPMIWVGRIQGFGRMNRVYGPDFMLEVCKLSVERGYRNFFFGGNDGVAQLLAEKLVARFPGLLVAGTYTPPFRPLNSREEEELISQVNACRPDVLWVGLSTPRQEKFMARYVDRLGVPLLVGVGAAFDIHTDRVREAPRWMMRLGMQWFHRLLQEPRRLWRRYLVNNPKFLFRITAQLLRSRAAL